MGELLTIFGTGEGYTATFDTAVLVHPLALVPVSVYCPLMVTEALGTVMFWKPAMKLLGPTHE
jgi:hypothetical protein